MKQAIAARGATALALPALRLASMPDGDATRQALRAALDSALVIFTSPAAVRFAARLQPLRGIRAAQVHAVGLGTARVLARQGLDALHPAADAMHSEGLLALPSLASAAIARAGGDVGLVTAPGGRGLLQQALRARGARVHVAEVYRRLPPRLDRRHGDALRASATPRAVLVTSAEALDHAFARLPTEAAARLRDSVAVVSSARLAERARQHGFATIIEASAPTPAALLDALQEFATRRSAR